jgi:hypothetical protein
MQNKEKEELSTLFDLMDADERIYLLDAARSITEGRFKRPSLVLVACGLPDVRASIASCG